MRKKVYDSLGKVHYQLGRAKERLGPRASKGKTQLQKKLQERMKNL